MDTKPPEASKPFEPVYVFVYGTLQGMHHGRNNIDFLGHAVTSGKYILYDGGFPSVRPVEGEDEVNAEFAARVKGEVHKVTDEAVLTSLDRYEGHPNFFTRKEIDVEVVNGDKLKAWMYHGPAKSVEHRKPKKPGDDGVVHWSYR